jgi:hypothetical protein
MKMRLRASLFSTAMIGFAATASSQTSESPVVASAKAGPCTMTVRGESVAFLIVVTGLEPGESLQIVSNSEGEIRKWMGQAQDDGRFGTIILPAVIGKSFGSANLQVVGKRCRIEASYPWRE